MAGKKSGQQNSFILPSARSILRGERNPDQTVNDKQAMSLYKRGQIDLQIAQALGVSKASVYRWRTAKGLKSNCNNRRMEVLGSYDYEQK